MKWNYRPMRNKALVCLVSLLALCILAGCAAKAPDNNQGIDPPIPQQPSTEPAPIEKDPIAEQVKGMSLEEKIGQMLIAGVDGYEINDNEVKLIREYHIGGFILFARNINKPEQLLKLTNSLKAENAANRAPLLISVDEEGGRISRLPKDVTNLPRNKTIGKINNKDFSYEVGLRLAEKVQAFGFNMDFAPVLDINSNPKNPVIGDRSFGTDAQLVSELGVQTMKGIKAGGVIPVVKHFPGHGDTAVDSHIGLPTVNNDLERLESFELIPFRDAINHDADCIMVAHIRLPKLDEENPASLSRTIITDVLRGKLQYKGVIITDDMNMGAIMETYDLAAAVLKAVDAGNDIILVAHKYENALYAFHTIQKAVLDGVLSEKRIDESVYRILALKSKYNLQDKPIDSVDVDVLNVKIEETLKKYK